MPPYALYVFDLDGTLVDSIADIAAHLNVILAEEKLPPVSEAEARLLVGGGVHELVRRAARGALDAERVADVARRYRARYRAAPCLASRPYPGVADTLARLPGKKAICTNKPGGIARDLVAALGLSRFFDLVLGEDDVGRRKPDPHIVEVARTRLGVSPADTLYVGDSLIDADTAEAAGVDLCLVTYGYARPEEIRARAARFILDRFSDLERIAESG
jgi:phosphoglycolate phosphatase